MTEDELRRYRDCARALAEVADPFIKRRLLDLARRYEDRMSGKIVKSVAIVKSYQAAPGGTIGPVSKR